jgi:class 3 adenylate cyclase
MREAKRTLADGRADDLILKIGLHEGPCLAVTLNDRLDYFGQTVNIASRVQGLAMSRAIFATETIIGHPEAPQLIAGAGLSAAPQRHALRGIPGELTVYEIA